MINTDMRLYDYYLISEDNPYPAEDAAPDGQIKMAINLTSQSVQDNINYSEAQYIGLTHAALDDSYIIQYGEQKLKVKYITPKGRLKQVFMVKT